MIRSMIIAFTCLSRERNNFVVIIVSSEISR